MAFETLSEKFSALFKKMRKEDKLTEANVESAIREIRIALLEADVNFKVVKAFTEDVREGPWPGSPSQGQPIPAIHQNLP